MDRLNRPKKRKIEPLSPTKKSSVSRKLGLSAYAQDRTHRHFEGYKLVVPAQGEKKGQKRARPA